MPIIPAIEDIGILSHLRRGKSLKRFRMNDYKIGDRVRLTIEGPVTWTTTVNGDVFDIANIVTVDASNPEDFKDVVYSIELVVDVPTKAGAVLYPYNTALYSILILDEEGDWYSPGGSSAYSHEAAGDRLREGTHYVAFDGVDD